MGGVGRLLVADSHPGRLVVLSPSFIRLPTGGTHHPWVVPAGHRGHMAPPPGADVRAGMATVSRRAEIFAGTAYCSHACPWKKGWEWSSLWPLPVPSLFMRAWGLLASRADSPWLASLEVASQESAHPEVVPRTQPRVGSRPPHRRLLEGSSSSWGLEGRSLPRCLERFWAWVSLPVAHYSDSSPRSW